MTLFLTAGPLSFLSDFGIEWQVLVSQMISFAVVAIALYYFVFRPVLKASDERQKIITKGIEDAKESELRLQKAQESSDEIIKKATLEAQEILNASRLDAKNLVDEAYLEANKKSLEVQARALAELETQKDAIRTQLKGEFSKMLLDMGQTLFNDVLTAEQKSALTKNAAKSLLEKKE